MQLYLFVFLLAALMLVFGIPTYRIYKRTGINPVTFGKEDNAHNYIGFIFKIMIVLLILVFTINFLFPDFYRKFFVPVAYLEINAVFWTGFALLHISMLWIFIAQMQMGRSWRIGIDEKNKTELVTHGIFSISRNPIFFGMIIAMLAAFMILPNIITFFLAVGGYIIIQIQIRLEEEFLEKSFGSQYISYKKKVRRLI